MRLINLKLRLFLFPKFICTFWSLIDYKAAGQLLWLIFDVMLVQSHIRVLESSPENISALLLGLEYLINISYVDDTEVFKVCLRLSRFGIQSGTNFNVHLGAAKIWQVCLDYWNSLVLELFEAHNNLDNPLAIASMMGLQVILVLWVRDYDPVLI